jgi:antitoxin component HigA of HigAB toxin-antitoxin module
MQPEEIKTENDYKAAFERFEEIFQAVPGTKESEEADVLALLLKDYEDRRYVSLSEIIEILETIKATIDKDTDFVWTRFNSLDELLTTIDSYILRLKNSDDTIYKQLNFEFAPTGTFQELSIQNGWGKEFLAISARFDTLYAQIIRHV